MIKGMDLGPAQGLESRGIVERELDWLDTLLADGRPYLGGNRFSRADITAASLLAPLVAPRQHPTYAAAVFPQAVAATMREWAERPALRKVRELYASWR
jgi:glutathione S-transferase